MKFLENYERRLRSHKWLFQYLHGKIKLRASVSTLINVNGKKVFTDQEKASALSEYFTSVCSRKDVNADVEVNGAILSHRVGDIYFHPDKISTIL